MSDNKTDGKHYMLKGKAFMDGALRGPGYLFTLKPGQLGPVDNTVPCELDDDGKLKNPKLLYEEVPAKVVDAAHTKAADDFKAEHAERAAKEKEASYEGGGRIPGEHGEAAKSETVHLEPRRFFAAPAPESHEMKDLLGIPAKNMVDEAHGIPAKNIDPIPVTPDDIAPKPVTDITPKPV